MFSASTSTSRKSTLILTVLTLLSTLLTHAEANNSTHVNVGPHRRHHHNKLARRNIPAEPLHDQSPVKRGIIASGSGHGTFYYDVSGGGGTCGPINGVFKFAETDGFGMCEPWTNTRSLRQRGSYKVVAISAARLGGNMANWCGKEVVINYKGNRQGGFILWDGCASCDGTGGIDFSSTEFGNVVGQSNCGLGRVEGVSWEITDNQIWDPKTGNPVGNAQQPPQQQPQQPAPTTTKKEEPKPSPKPEPTTEAKPEPKPTTTSTKAVQPVERPVEKPSTTTTTSSTQRTTTTSQQSPSSSNDDDKPSATPSSSSVLSSMSRTRTRTRNGGKCTRKSTRRDGIATPQQFLAAPNTAVAAAAEPSSSSCSPGAWKCVDKTLQQCVQGKSWHWQTRVVCGTTPINCDSPNPVCTDIVSGQ